MREFINSLTPTDYAVIVVMAVALIALIYLLWPRRWRGRSSRSSSLWEDLSDWGDSGGGGSDGGGSGD